MDTHTAANYKSFGTPDVLEVTSQSLPDQADKEVLVDVETSGINPLDVKIRAGAQGGVVPAGGIIPRNDGAGTVVNIGKGVEGLSPGDRVWIWGVGTSIGTAAQRIVVPASRVTPLPDRASFELGAALGIPAVTAALCLMRMYGHNVDLSQQPFTGKTVVVRGSGGVGHFAIQLARWAGARVVATTNSSKVEVVRASGADSVLNRDDKNFHDLLIEACPDGADVIVDVAPALHFAQNIGLAAPRGTVAHYGRVGGDEAPVNFKILQAKNIEVRNIRTVDLPEDDLRRGVDEVVEALKQDSLSIGDDVGLPVRTFPLQDIALAHDFVEKETHAKVILTVS